MTRLPEHVAVAVRVGEILEQEEISHMVCGSIASSIHGEPRSTYDIDLVVDLRADAIPALVAALSQEFLVDPAALQYALDTGSSCNVVHRATATKVDWFVLRAREFSRVEFGRRTRQRIARDPDRFLALPTPEDMILSKLEWYRKGGEVSDRQWRDVCGMVRLQGERLDLEYLDHWARELGLDDLWARARAR